MIYLRPFFLVVDQGFIAYWLITYMKWIPAAYLFPDYSDPTLVAWNWSFLPLDLLISITGLGSIALYNRGNALWKPAALISLVLTFTSGLQAIAFWVIQGWFDWGWWLPNLFLLIYPCFFVPGLLRALRADP